MAKKKCKQCGAEITSELFIEIPHATKSNPDGKFYFCCPKCKFEYDHRKEIKKGLYGLVEIIYNSYGVRNIPWGLVYGRIKSLKMDEQLIYEILYYLYNVKKLSCLYSRRSNSIFEMIPYYQKEYQNYKADKENADKDFDFDDKVIIIKHNKNTKDISEISID